ncbi:M23 family metallopeptidase [Glycomyces tenuis]|uniref:M23 family metallopeptidase n=1 Tax=Glycomyces tenuis TaxID=58116 RepID=UPI00042A0E9A|nr:M23 family metallopeptidase [Glycomyces tenuis]
MRTDGRLQHPLREVTRRIVLAFAAFALAVAGAMIPATAANAQDVSIQAVSHKSPFNCNKVFDANNWTGGHNPSNTIDWQTAGSDGINGETVRATAGGTAYFYNEGGDSYGRWVQIVHSDGSRTRYAHLATQVRSPGSSMSVSQGTVIGTVGSTGNSSAPHLHYEQRNSSGSVVTPVVEGVRVPLGTEKAIKSTNACGGGGGNPYTPREVCGSGFSVINSHALSGGRIYLLYNGSTGYNCVVTIKTTKIGTPSPVSATLQKEGGTKGTDSGNFAYYAGPVKRHAPNTCVKWGGSVGSSSWTSGWSHCG